MTTLLAKKAGFEWPMAADDDHFYQMTKDPSLSQFPPGSNYEAFNQNYYNQYASGNLNVSVSNTPVLTEAGDNAGQNAEILVKHNKESADWINRRWRPAMGWMYMIVCIFDFILFPIMFTMVQFWETQAANDAFRQWQPVTLMGAGLFHMAMGAVLGIAAYGRTKEKLEGATKN